MEPKSVTMSLKEVVKYINFFHDKNVIGFWFSLGTKWAISYEAWPWKHYPLYSTGGAVLYPGFVITHLLAAAQTIPYIPFEDAYTNGLCAEKAKILNKYSKRY